MPSVRFGALALFSIAMHAWLAVAGAQAKHRDDSRVRLQAVDAPDPFSPPSQASHLFSTIFVRKLAGLGDEDEDDDTDCDEDREGRGNHNKSFHVTVEWTIKSSSSIIRKITKTFELRPPYTFVKLDVGHGKKKKFARLEVSLTWDGTLASGQNSLAGTYAYEAVAEFQRVHEHRNRTIVKLVGESNPVSGTVTLASGTTPPSISLASPNEGLLTRASSVQVTGVVAGTPPISVTIAGMPVTLTSGAFSQATALQEGGNEIAIVATSAAGSASVTRHVTRDSIDPTISISSPATGTTTGGATPTLVVNYSDVGSGLDLSTLLIKLDSADITSNFSVGAGQASYTLAQPLVPGIHRIDASVRDRAGGVATALSSFTIASKPAPPSVDPAPVLTNVPLITLSGQKEAFTAVLVNGVERVPLSEATSWVTTKTLAEGINSLSFATRSQYGLVSDSVSVNVTLDTVPPPAPVSSIPPAVTTTRTVQISGTKEPGTAVIVNGVVVSPIDNSTTWEATIPLLEGTNNVLVESVDVAGNKSLAAGSQQTGVSDEKPVIRDLTVTPPEITTGQTASLSYRLFAAVPPAENADLQVRVRIEAGDLLIKELFSGVQQGGPEGPTYTATWDGTDYTGTNATVNQSYRVVISATRVAPTTAARELVDANQKESAILLTGSQHFVSKDKRLEVIFRPDDAKMSIQAFPTLPAQASRLLTSRSLHPHSCYRVTLDRSFSGAAVGVLTCAEPDGRLIRPYLWDDLQADWSPVGRANWNPATRQLSFTLPRPGLLLFATADDVDQPYLTSVQASAGQLTARIRDDGSGVDTRKVRLRRRGRDISNSLKQKLINGVHEVLLTADGVSSLDNLTLYVEDWAGHGRLIPLDDGRAP